MRTVKELKEELTKFPDEALCWAYEGEVMGIGVMMPSNAQSGFIFCSERPSPETKETILLH